MNELYDTAREEHFRAHLEERYGVRVMNIQRLDRGVVNVNLQDGRRWIVRIFPAWRALEQAEGDAAILQFLEQQGFPAERCADAEPVSALYGRGILVTEYIKGKSVEPDLPMLRKLGELLARLHMLPVENGATAREAGALHHYSRSGGGPQHELAAAASWLAEIEQQVPEQGRMLFESLREQVAHADNCLDLPTALIHPDPVLKNVLITGDNEPVFIDWTGAGCGPRLASFAVLLWSCALKRGGWSPRRVDAVVAGYRSHIQLEERELARLAAVMRIRPLVFACRRYRYALTAQQPPDGSEWWWLDDELVQAIAARACAAFQK